MSPCLFNLYAEYIMRYAGLDEAQARIKIAGRNINNLRYADNTTFMAESPRVVKSPTRLSDFTFTHWRRKWQPTPVFLPGESQGRGSLVGCRLWGHTELDTTEVT